MSKQITLNVNDTPIHFDVTNDDHERLIEDMQQGAKVASTHNFLMRCVTEEDKETLKPFLENPGVVMAIGTKVLNEFVPTISITVGK